MSQHTNRRQFLKTSAVIGAGYFAAAGAQRRIFGAPSDTVRFACIGVGGKGSSDTDDAGRNGDVVALCDVDEGKVAAKAKKFEKAEKFADFRKMLEKMDKSIDAVTVSTPDHMHAPAALMAMRMGKHCFCQKPSTRTIYEARLIGQVAREKKVATQMGNQGTAKDGVRRAAALLKAGFLGKVKEVHVFTNRPIWPQGGERQPEEPVPAGVDWDLWLGVAPKRPFAKNYHPFAWRGWWDFGSGALGDMACHTVNMPFMGLDLRNPTSVVAKTSGHNKDSYPKWSIITFEFPANEWRPGLKFVWYDGGQRPDDEVMPTRDEIVKKLNKDPKKYKPPTSGCVIVGEKGKLFSPDDYGAEFFVTTDIAQPEVKFTESPGHFVEWVEAIKGGKPAMSNFPDYAGPLTETILLGNLAVWAADQGEGKKIEWDAKNLVATNAPEVMHIVKPTYRAGYTL